MTEHPRGSLTCYYCAEVYDLGQPYAKGSFLYYPDGEYAYWAHCRTEPHQAALSWLDRNTYALMARMPEAIEYGKAIQRQARDPQYHLLKEVLR